MTIFTQSHLQAQMPLNDVNIFQCQAPHVARPQRCFHTFFFCFFPPRFWLCLRMTFCPESMFLFCIFLLCVCKWKHVCLYTHINIHTFFGSGALNIYIYIYNIYIYIYLYIYIYMGMSVEVRRLQRGFLGFRGGLWMYHFPPGQIMMTGPSLKLHPPCIDHCQESIYRLLKWYAE